MPPMMVAPERLVPGISAKACAMPSLAAHRAASARRRRGCAAATASAARARPSRMTRPPTMNAIATGTGVEQVRLDVAARTARRARPPAGRRSTTLSAKRCARGSLNECRQHRARSARGSTRSPPTSRRSGSTTSNTFAFSPCKPSRLPARIRWPVLEIGRNSVRPSTMPRIAALTSNGNAMSSSHEFPVRPLTAPPGVKVVTGPCRSVDANLQAIGLAQRLGQVCLGLAHRRRQVVPLRRAAPRSPPTACSRCRACCGCRCAALCSSIIRSPSNSRSVGIAARDVRP